MLNLGRTWQTKVENMLKKANFLATLSATSLAFSLINITGALEGTNIKSDWESLGYRGAKCVFELWFIW